MQTRDYKSTDLPTFNESNPEHRFEIAKQIYSEVNANYRHLADVRFRLLGFVPAVSALVWAELLARIPASDTRMSVAGMLIGFFGLTVTHGIRLYDRRNDGLYNDLISRGRKIEDEWNIHTGIFKGRMKGIEKDIFKQQINHGRALNLIYSSIYLGWIFTILWYGGNLVSFLFN